MKKLLFVLLLLPLCGYGQVDTIITVAGNGSGGDSGDGGSALLAKIAPYSNVVFDASGNYYITQYMQNTIRKISSGGIISTFAGTGVAGYAGDSGAALSAQLNGPGGMAIDDSDNLYVADSYNNVIRKINVITGIIITCAGNGLPLENGDNGPALAASIYSPRDVCFDRTGNLYISDADNRIRKVDINTGIITTVAGKGGAVGFSGDSGPADSAQLNGPQGICTDTSGNLYIADYYNDRIRKVNATTGIITTIAGNGIGTYNGEGIPSISAQLNPWRLMFDVHNNLFIADQHNWRVRKIDTAGNIYTVAGNGIEGYSGDCGPADSAELCGPYGLGFNLSGDLYINDVGCDLRIRKITAHSNCFPSLEIASNSLTTHAISIYPNPATTSLTITSPDKITQITITNVLGQTVYSSQFAVGSLQPSIDVANLACGLYFVKVNDGVVRKFVKE